MSKSLVAVFLGLAIISAGCAEALEEVATETTLAVPGAVRQPAEAAVDQGAPPAVPDPPTLEGLRAKLRENPNDLSTPVGALCWARWETARAGHLLVLEEAEARSAAPGGASIPVRGEADRAQMMDAALERATSADVWDRALSPELPGEVRVFAEALRDLLEGAPRGVDSQSVDYDSLPGIDTYAQAAQREPGCISP